MANKGNSEETTQIHSSSQTKNHSRTEPNRDMDKEKGSKPERKEGPSGDSLPDNAPKEDEETTQIHSSSQTKNHPHSRTEPNREVDGEKGSKPERKEGQSGDSLPDNAPKEDDEETGTLSCQLSDSVQQGTDPRIDPGHDTKEKSESSSEPEEKQTEETTQIHSSSQTKNHPHSRTEPNREVDGEKGSKPERKEGQSGDSLPDNAPKEDDEETTQIHSSSQTKNHPHSRTEPNRDMDREKGNKLERKEGQSGDSLSDNAPKEDEETGTLSCQLSDSMQQGTDPRIDPGHDTKEKSESSSEPEEKQTEETTQIHSSSQTKNHPHSHTEPNREVDGEKGSKPERTEESLFNIQKPKEEETASNIHEEDVERHENVQPPIIVPGKNKTFWTAAAVILLALVCALCQRSPDSTPPIPNEVNVVDVFNQEMKKLETTFPNQHPELWRRSLIHLRRHLKTKNPTEPVSLILTSDHRAEKTLGCLALCLARAFSNAHNSSVLNINGKNKASQDSDQVKLDIDSELRKAFEGKKSAAVIHHFEELPPGSTLIFYRYCDHENAAYKDVFLAFTVMLDEEVEVTSNVSLGRVEEMVQEHIKQKFVSSDKSAMFNQMDVDKLGGLWSRISHLILPVAAEKKIEEQGCGDL